MTASSHRTSRATRDRVGSEGSRGGSAVNRMVGTRLESSARSCGVGADDRGAWHGVAAAGVAGWVAVAGVAGVAGVDGVGGGCFGRAVVGNWRFVRCAEFGSVCRAVVLAVAWSLHCNRAYPTSYTQTPDKL